MARTMARTTTAAGIDNPTRPLFELSAQTHVAASPDEVYAVVSNLSRSSEWSPECVGGTWIKGRPAEVGSVFRGENRRAPDVVAWAPVVRGTWFTESEVVAAEPGRTFQWSMRTQAGEKQDSIWAYDVVPAGDGGTVLTHRFRMGRATEGIRGIVADMDDRGRERFFVDWGEKVAADLETTLARIKRVVEHGPR
jgi:hypothetical protein